jgi:hypothetical protein
MGNGQSEKQKGITISSRLTGEKPKLIAQKDSIFNFRLKFALILPKKIVINFHETCLFFFEIKDYYTARSIPNHFIDVRLMC